MNTESTKGNVRRLPLMGDALEASLQAFESEERARLGLEGKTEQWIEDMANLTFTKKEKSDITMLVSGLTIAHDYFVEGALRGVGYNVMMMDPPDNAALQYGKEFGNRGQCNPTYFTVGNLVKFLCTLRDKGMTSEEVVKKYVFLTAGACGPCRFGMYVTEYRKALRDAGFDGFRVVLFQQKGGLEQATGEESGLELNATFFIAIVKALVAGDVINAIGYRIRPYEVNAGDTDRALEAAKKIVYKALLERTNVLRALMQAKPLFDAVPVDKTQAKPKVSIIGEFWAMTTEGDGNYQLQRFLESEGAEDDIQLVTAWILYTVWEVRRDTWVRKELKAQDGGKYGLAGQGTFGTLRLWFLMILADKAVRMLFHTFAYSGGLYGYKLADMDALAEISDQYYSNDLRGGEGHMEVGKLIMNVVHQKAHMTLSVKPFGCMPSAGVSDGVQTAIAEKLPGTIFCPVETSGDGRVNFYSRVQMFLFKAKQAAVAELERAYAENGVSKEEVQAFLDSHPRFASPLHKAPHAYAGSAADLVAEVAPYITMSRTARLKKKLGTLLDRSAKAAKVSPHMVVKFVETAVAEAPGLAAKVKEDLAALKEERATKKKTKKTEAAAAA
jgi:predicted nucleotide-binding protein (sugar kinase/HSP70/actin superfamily)